jgi:polar amino acid transport system substrate-binding protein
MFGTRPARGLYPEIIREAFALAGLTAEVNGYPWKRALSLGRSGKAFVGGIYQNLERLKIFEYSDPLYLETLVVCVKKGQAFDFNGVVDLKGKRVGINRGWSYGEVIDSARRAGLFQVEEATGDQANLKKLILGRLVDRFIRGSAAE